MTTPPTPTPSPAPSPAPAPAPAPPEDDTIRMSPAQLKERMDRHTRAQLKELGFGSVEELTAFRESARKLEEERKQRELQSMSELERERVTAAAEREARLKAEARAAELEEQRAANELERLVATECAARGIRNVDFAVYAVVGATKRLGDDASFDVGAFLDKQIEDAAKRAAYGLPAAAPAPTPSPATTTHGGTPPPAPPPNPSPQEKTDKDLTPAEWAARKRQLGIL